MSQETMRDGTPHTTEALMALVDQRPAEGHTIVSDEMASILGRKDAADEIKNKENDPNRRRLLNSGRHAIIMFVYMLDRLQARSADYAEAVGNFEALDHNLPNSQ